MSILLFVLTVVLTFFAVACAVIYLFLNNFSTVSDLAARNRNVKTMMKVSMIAALVTALFSGLFSDSEEVETAVGLTVILYYVIAISMLSVILLSCTVLIYRFITKKSYHEGTTSGVAKMITLAAVGAGISLVLAWLLS